MKRTLVLDFHLAALKGKGVLDFHSTGAALAGQWELCSASMALLVRALRWSRKLLGLVSLEPRFQKRLTILLQAEGVLDVAFDCNEGHVRHGRWVVMSVSSLTQQRNFQDYQPVVMRIFGATYSSECCPRRLDVPVEV